ncbi:hypothetical protein EVAR_77840_1 [Eumeta japonica]|uniref:Uncharacterized protein n=1 Tax=Eumeta variegata TaxID=151549 RepID=A0A4C1TBA0_EUMVA|nr:hypothetical protein EVAR_77840_1 [Eumeta japonica]
MDGSTRRPRRALPVRRARAQVGDAQLAASAATCPFVRAAPARRAQSANRARPALPARTMMPSRAAAEPVCPSGYLKDSPETEAGAPSLPAPSAMLNDEY